MPGCHTVIALVIVVGVGDWHWLESGLTLKKVMLTLLLGDGHITCLAMSALFPLITKRDLQNQRCFVQVIYMLLISLKNTSGIVYDKFNFLAQEAHPATFLVMLTILIIIIEQRSYMPHVPILSVHIWILDAAPN